MRADSEYQTLEDIKRKSFPFADPNSTSGYAVPSHCVATELNTAAADYFSEVSFSGSQEQSVMALVNGTFEAVATHWRNETAGNIETIEKKGLIAAGSTRIIRKSPVIPNTPVMILTALPQDLQDALKSALMAFPEQHPEAFATYSNGTSSGYVEASHEDFLDVIAITEFNAQERRKDGD